MNLKAARQADPETFMVGPAVLAGGDALLKETTLRWGCALTRALRGSALARRFACRGEAQS